MKVEEERQKELAREQRRLQKVRELEGSDRQMKEEAIARGEEVSDSEEEVVDEDPGNIPKGGAASVLTHVCIPRACPPRSSATPTSFWRWWTPATRSYASTFDLT